MIYLKYKPKFNWTEIYSDEGFYIGYIEGQMKQQGSSSRYENEHGVIWLV